MAKDKTTTLRCNNIDCSHGWASKAKPENRKCPKCDGTDLTVIVDPDGNKKPEDVEKSAETARLKKQAQAERTAEEDRIEQLLKVSLGAEERAEMAEFEEKCLSGVMAEQPTPQEMVKLGQYRIRAKINA